MLDAPSQSSSPGSSPSARTDDGLAGFTAHVAQVARQRAAAWDAFADVLTAPEVDTVVRLRSGELTEIWRAGVSWVGADTEMFTAALMSLDVYARAASRRTLDSDHAAFEADHAALVAPYAATLANLRAVARSCSAEAAAWADADLARGKDLRAHQHALVDEHLVPVLPELAERLVVGARSDIWRVLGRLLLAFVSIETGRDYQRALLGEARARLLHPTD
ncbi:hypothetical protein [Pengzhenrongella phosphoraccumulans]|uniref:hypothetical protein n=1 Tax=Pengzhenrongella phosphoraccumulans TaxID=3114394 RepID=UPI0038908C13